MTDTQADLAAAIERAGVYSTGNEQQDAFIARDLAAALAPVVDRAVEDALRPVRDLADHWAGQSSSGVKIHCGRRLSAVVDDR